MDRFAAPLVIVSPLVADVGSAGTLVGTAAVVVATVALDSALAGDRILVATARVMGATLLTVDERIIAARIVATLG